MDRKRGDMDALVGEKGCHGEVFACENREMVHLDQQKALRSRAVCSWILSRLCLHVSNTIDAMR